MWAIKLHGHLPILIIGNINVLQGSVCPRAILLKDNGDINIFIVFIPMGNSHEIKGLADGPVAAAALLASAFFNVPLLLEVSAELTRDEFDRVGAVFAEKEIGLP